eukprot:5704161-Pleurochrysis_carterae.AAC.1
MLCIVVNYEKTMLAREPLQQMPNRRCKNQSAVVGYQLQIQSSKWRFAVCSKRFLYKSRNTESPVAKDVGSFRADKCRITQY